MIIEVAHKVHTETGEVYFLVDVDGEYSVDVPFDDTFITLWDAKCTVFTSAVLQTFPLAQIEEAYYSVGRAVFKVS